MSLIHFSGNFIEVADRTLTDARSYYAGMTPEHYKDALNKDIDRTCYVSFQGSIDENQRRLRDTTHLEGKTYSFSQGQIHGGLFTQISTFEKRMKLMQCGDRELVDQLSNEFCFSYIDKDGSICGLSVVFMLPFYELDMNGSKRAVSMPQAFASGKYPFSLCVVRNVVNTPSEIHVDYFAHPDLLCLDTLLNSDQDPNLLSFDELRVLLKNQNGCILFNNALYYVNIIDMEIQRIEQASTEKDDLIATINSLEMNQARYATEQENEQIKIAARIPAVGVDFKRVNFNPNEDLVDGLTEASLRAWIQNDELSDALCGMIEGDKLDIKKFNAFAARLHVDGNIDDRDHRKENFEKLIEAFKVMVPYWSGLNDYISNLQRRAQKEMSFYRTDNFKEIIHDMVAKVNEISAPTKVKEMNPLKLLCDAVLREIQIFEDHGMGDKTKLNLKNEANFYRAQSDFMISLLQYEQKLKTKKIQSQSKDLQKFYAQGHEILYLIQDHIDLNPSLSQGEYLHLTKILQCCSDVLDQPMDKKAIQKLEDLSKEAIGHKKPIWKALGFALMVFAGLALALVGLLIAIPTAGSSLMVSALGTSAVISGFTGLGFFNHGQAEGVAKSLDDFKNELIVLQKNHKFEEEPGVSPSCSSQEDTVSEDSVELSNPPSP